MDPHAKDLTLLADVLGCVNEKETLRRQLQAERLQWGQEAHRLQEEIAALRAKLRSSEEKGHHGNEQQETPPCGS